MVRRPVGHRLGVCHLPPNGNQSSDSMKPAISSTLTPATAISGAYTTSSAAQPSVPSHLSERGAVLALYNDVGPRPLRLAVDLPPASAGEAEAVPGSERREVFG